MLTTCSSSKAINRWLSPKPNSCSRAIFPPQAQTIDKGHGRVETRQIWTLPVDGATVGLAGAAQIFRVDQKVEYVRRGKVFKITQESRYGVTSLVPEEADPQSLLALVRGYWSIEIKQHYRRDHTQREDEAQDHRARKEQQEDLAVVEDQLDALFPPALITHGTLRNVDVIRPRC